MELGDHRLVFVGGLHRSGTTPMARLLAAHPQVSGFEGTGVKEDEGQHLQTIYPSARAHGGPGNFAGSPTAHLTENSPLATPDNAGRLLAEWEPHWDLDKPVLVEKSPPNLLMTRFLQGLYPDASFVIMVRHPVVVSLSTRKWVGGSWDGLLSNWFAAHDLFAQDAARLHRLHVVKYEDLIEDTETVLAGVARFLGLTDPIPPDTVQRHRSRAYEDQWQALRDSSWPWRKRGIARVCKAFEPRARHYGYSMTDLAVRKPFPIVGMRHPA